MGTFMAADTQWQQVAAVVAVSFIRSSKEQEYMLLRLVKCLCFYLTQHADVVDVVVIGMRPHKSVA